MIAVLFDAADRRIGEKRLNPLARLIFYQDHYFVRDDDTPAKLAANGWGVAFNQVECDRIAELDDVEIVK